MNSEEIKNTEAHLANILRGRKVASGDDTIKFRKDEAFVENPMERRDAEHSLKVEDIKDLEAVYNFAREKCEVSFFMCHNEELSDFYEYTNCF